MWFWPYEFNRDDLLPLRVTDGGVLVESKRTGTRILLAVPPEDVMPILREWGYATFRESEPAPSPVPPRRRLPDPPL